VLFFKRRVCAYRQNVRHCAIRGAVSVGAAAIPATQEPEHRTATGIVPKEICATAAAVHSGGNRKQLCLESGLFVCLFVCLFLLLLQMRTVRCTGCGASLTLNVVSGEGLHCRQDGDR